MEDQDHRDRLSPEWEPDADDGSMAEARLTSPGPADRETREPSEMEEGRRPTPVRAVMLGGDEGDEGHRVETRILLDEESGLEWVVTVCGQSAGGILPLRNVPLLELNFARAEEPGRPLRRTVCCGGDLVDIPDHELLTYFKDSEPFREPPTPTGGKGRSGKRGKNRRGVHD